MKITIGKKEVAERLYRIDEMRIERGSYRSASSPYGDRTLAPKNIFISASPDIILEINPYVPKIHIVRNDSSYEGWLFRRTNESITISFEE